tara:strand:- start:3542 stop:4564 length:1023 start_codon:yes stop_codon:yes gene_type:complete
MTEPVNIFDPHFLRGSKELQHFLLSLLKGGLDKQARDAVGRAAAAYVNGSIGPHIGQFSQEAPDKITHTLDQRGYAVIEPIFSDQQIKKITDFLSDKPVLYGHTGQLENGKQGEVELKDLPESTRFAHYKPEDVLQCPEISEAVLNKALITTVGHYLRAPPTISSVALWWSYPSNQEPGGMQSFHHDRGDFRSCNLFVYLTNVSEETGPHAFVAGTHDFDLLYADVMERFGGYSERFSEFWQWMQVHRKTDDDVLKYFENEIKVYTGPKGTSFLEDTRGLHKATIPTKGPRLAFEIVYTTLPKFNEPVLLASRLGAGNVRIGNGNAQDPLVKYATRAIYR